MRARVRARMRACVRALAVHVRVRSCVRENTKSALCGISSIDLKHANACFRGSESCRLRARAPMQEEPKAKSKSQTQQTNEILLAHNDIEGGMGRTCGSRALRRA